MIPRQEWREIRGFVSVDHVKTWPSRSGAASNEAWFYCSELSVGEICVYLSAFMYEHMRSSVSKEGGGVLSVTF